MRGLLEGRMQSRGQLHFAVYLSTALDDVQKADNCFSAVVIQLTGTLITHPAMDTTTTRVHPHNLLESKVVYVHHQHHIM